MGFEQIRDQDPAVRTLVRALESGRIHHAYRFEGPEGVGKELAAFAFAQALVCERGAPLPCGTCSACHRALTLSADEPRVPLHPDVVLVERALYSSSVVGASEATGISVEQIRRIVLARAGYPPHEGRGLVFIIRAAHELTVQAANALLKTLEEPIPRVHFVLLTSQPNRLLDTIRSRTFGVRFGPLSEATIGDILEQSGADRNLASVAQGSAAEALALADADVTTARQQFADAALAALQAPDLATALQISEDRANERGGLRDQIVFLAHTLARRSRERITGDLATAELDARRHRVVLEALKDLERNVQPALVVEAMITRMRRV